MIHEVEISPEVVKLAQHRMRTLGGALNDELARSVVEEAVYALDPEAEFLLEEERAFSSNDALAAAFAVNDVVVNGRRLDVRAIDEEGRVSLSRALVGTCYMTAGTLVVQMNGTLNGKIVAFVPAGEWQALEQLAGDQQNVFTKARVDNDFDLKTALNNLEQQPYKAAPRKPSPFEIATFVANRGELPVNKQRSITDSILGNQQCWEEIEDIVSTWCKGSVRRVLTDSGVWNRRVEKVSKLVAPRFKKVSADEVRKIVARIGETFGGQPENPAFRKALLNTLTREELSRSLAGAALKKAATVAEAVISGRAVNDAVKEVAKNQVAVQIATQIKRQREKVSGFVDATAQELSTAFQQLALQPAYATHSSDPASGMDAINEALKMLDAAEFAEQVQSLDEELSRL